MQLDRRQPRDCIRIEDLSAKDLNWSPPLTLCLALTPVLKTRRGVPLDLGAC